MKVIIDGVFNHCGSFNKWLDREHIYSTSPEQYASGAYESFNSPYHTFLNSTVTSGRITTRMTAGGATTPCRSLTTRKRIHWSSIF